MKELRTGNMDKRKSCSQEESPFITGRSTLAKLDIICLKSFSIMESNTAAKMVKGRCATLFVWR